MALFMSEWYQGYDLFVGFCSMFWDPTPIAKLKPKPDTNEAAIAIQVSLIMDQALNAFISDLVPEKFGKEFVDRYNRSCFYLIKMVDLNSALNPIVASLVRKYNLTVEDDFDSFQVDLKQNLYDFLWDYEFMHRIDLFAMLANLIFYGTVEDLHPAIFFVPPVNRMSEYDNWEGYGTVNGFF